MTLRSFSRGFLAASIVALSAVSAVAGTFVQPTTYYNAPPSGLSWSAVATGTALPVRTSATNPLNGAPGAVVYFNVDTGQIQFDPKGLSVSTFILTYTTGTVNIGAATAGPFQYTTGTGDFSYSDISGTERTFPAKAVASSGLAPTTYASRVGLSVGPPLSASLNNGSNPNSASSNGFWNVSWAFPLDLVKSGSLAGIKSTFDTVGTNFFRTTGQAANANANLLGYGSQQGVFQYTASGITGNQLGAVIPVTAVPEPSTVVLAGVGLAAAGGVQWRRRKLRSLKA